MTEKIILDSQNVDWSDQDSVIAFYENNQLYFDNYELLSDQDSIIETIQTKASYVKALTNKRRYKKALHVTDHIKLLLEKVDDNNLKNKLEEQNQFFIGCLKGYLKAHQEAFIIFKKLTKQDPDNDVYEAWYIHEKTNLFQKRISFISYGGMAIVFGDIASGILLDFDFNKYLVLIGFVLLFSGWLIPAAYKQIEKRKRNK